MSTTEEAALLASMMRRIAALERAASRREWQPGDIKQTVATVAEEGWLFFGQSILNADTLYPALWAVAPASWKSGTSLTLPVLTDRVLREGVTVGDLAGSDSTTLTIANLPSHDHSINHGHADTLAAPAHTHTLPNHVHTMAHTHSIDPPPTTTSTTGAHAHTQRINGFAAVGATGNLGGNAANNANGGATASAGDHEHTVNIASFTSGGSSAANTGNPTTLPASGGASATALTGSVTNHTGVSGPTGSGTAVNHTPAHMTVRTMIKV